MKSFKHNRLNEFGFGLHIILPVIVIVAVASIGVYLLKVSNAATCMDYTYSQSNTTNNGSTAAACTNYIQKILNGAYQSSSSPTFFSLAVDGIHYGVNGFISNSGTFDTNTTAAVEAFQDYYANLNITGRVDSQTWTALCGIGLHMPNPDASHYSEQEALGAAQHSGCANQAAPAQSSPSTWALKGSTIQTSSSGASVTFSSTITNNGPASTGAFAYGPRYFYSSTAHPTPVAGGEGAYANEISASPNIHTSGLAKGASITGITQTIDLQSAGTYICATVAFSPMNSRGTPNGRGYTPGSGAPICLNVANQLASSPSGE